VTSTRIVAASLIRVPYAYVNRRNVTFDPFDVKEAAVPDTPTAVMERFVSAFESGDLPGACALLHPEAVIREADGLPYSGEYTGPDGFAALVGAMAGSFEFKLLDTEYLPVDDERIVMRMVARFTSRATGNSVEFPVVEIYTVRDGLIRDVDVYYKNPAGVTALQAG
jgi:ketosteroid isomerase-like protein